MSTPNLEMTVALLDTCSRARVATRRIRWESMALVLQILRKSFRETLEAPLSEREVEIARHAWKWASVCMDGPVPPGHPSTGIARLLLLIREADEVLGLPKLRRLHDALTQVTNGPHPGAEVVIGALGRLQETTEFLQSQFPDVLVLRGDGLVAVTEWRDSLDLPADVVSMSFARQTHPWPGSVFIFGPPERYTSSNWIQGPEAAATAGWLLTAPPAPTVQVISWTGHRPLVKDGYQPWLGAPNPEFQSTEPELIIEDDFLPESIDSFTPVVAPRFAVEGDETEPAFGLQFNTDGETVLAYFSHDVGPKPTTVTFSEDEVLVTPVPLRTVRVGNCILLRTSSAGKDALDEVTREWFREQRSGSTPDSAIGHQQQLKNAIRAFIAEHSRVDLVTAMEAEGVSRDYSRSFMVRALHPDFIAPQMESVYDQICRAIALKPSKEAFRQLKNLRTGRRQAGLLLSARVVGRLETMNDLPDRLRDNGAIMLNETGVEGVVLLVVRAISSDSTEVPAWRLGHALMSDGHTWTP